MSYTYSTWLTAFAEMLATDPTDTDFLAMAPSAIDYAEQRVYRDLDLLTTIVRDASTTCTANSRTFNLPSAQGRAVVLEDIAIVTPVGTTTATGGTRNLLSSVSRAVIDMSWPSETAASASTVPSQYGMVTDQQIIFGPPPGAAYAVEATFTIRPIPLSSTNTSTYLTQYLPDIWMVATMIFGGSWQKNFSATGDDPQGPMSWEKQYFTLMTSANIEESRKKFSSVSWTSKSPSPAAAPQRG